MPVAVYGKGARNELESKFILINGNDLELRFVYFGEFSAGFEFINRIYILLNASVPDTHVAGLGNAFYNK